MLHVSQVLYKKEQSDAIKEGRPIKDFGEFVGHLNQHIYNDSIFAGKVHDNIVKILLKTQLVVEQKYAIIGGGDKIEQTKGVEGKEQQVTKTRDHPELPVHPEHSEEPSQTKDELDVKLQKIIQEFVKDKPEYAEKINKIGYKELKEQLVEYATSSHDQLQEQDWWGNITSGIKELFGVSEAEAAFPLLAPITLEIIKYGGAALILSLTAYKLASESDGNNLQSDFEKRKHDDRGKSSATTGQQQKYPISSTFMPDPDDFEPDDDKKKDKEKIKRSLMNVKSQKVQYGMN